MTSGEGMSFEMERYFSAVQPEMGMKAKRILEVTSYFFISSTGCTTGPYTPTDRRWAVRR